MNIQSSPERVETPIASLAESYNAGDADARKEVQGIIEKANAGERQAANKITRLIKAFPRLADTIALDLARVVEDSLIRRICGEGSLASIEVFRHRQKLLQEELAGPNPTAIERLLAERAALCWLDCHFTDFLARETKNQTIRQADFSARQHDRAHRRYLSALKALVSVRKLSIVAVQVNMGSDARLMGGG